MTPRPTPRPVIEDVRPRVDSGDFPAKGVVGSPVTIEADAFADGHDLLYVEACYRVSGDTEWLPVAMRHLGNDRWQARFTPERVDPYEFHVRAVVDHFGTWLRDLHTRLAAGQAIDVELLVGRDLALAAAENARAVDRKQLLSLADELASGSIQDFEAVIDNELAGLVTRHSGQTPALSAVYGVDVERDRAQFSTWYELFPRSASTRRGRHGTLLDVVKRLPYLTKLGVDVLYLPPIHPIGSTARKGRNGATKAKRGDVGSPWAIGAAEGGHTAIHPQLGADDDLLALTVAARASGIEVALDLAFQCSPDHPWVTEHPAWFKHRPDGSIRYAENPPKKYEDIYPIDFESADWQALWDALRDVVEHWIALGITIFRVDNPHTKPFAFWEWLIAAVRAEHPEIIFLAEAFTRPKIMGRLAKTGFSQSYTYFTWRNEKWELEEYLTDLTRTELADYFRPNFWPNTPDILPPELQQGNRETFIVRALLAGTLSSSYGIYGPVFELGERAPRFEGSEEYLDSEKYELRKFDLTDPGSIAPFLARLNTIRRDHPALHHNRTLRFHHIDNTKLIAYSKTADSYPGGLPSADLSNAPILVIANLDTEHQQSGWVELDLDALGLDALGLDALGPEPESTYTVRDLLTDATYEWKGHRNFVILDPATTPAHLFRIEVSEA